MVVNQIYQIVNSLYQQLTGQSDIVATNATGLIQMGKALDLANMKDKFFGAMTDAIRRTIIPTRIYNPDDGTGDETGLIMGEDEFGALTRKFYVAPPDAQTAVRWNLPANGSTVDPFVINRPEVNEYWFYGINAYDIPITLPDYQIKSAFNNAEEMAAVINGIQIAVENSIKAKAQAMAKLCYSNFIGELATTDTAGIHVVKLLTEYNTLTNITLTPTEAMTDEKFLMFATFQINSYLSYLSDMSSVFNTAEYVRFTPRDYARVRVLTYFAKSVDSYLRSNVYHDELVSLPNYREVNFWQGNGQAYTLEKLSSIDITTSSGKVAKVGNVIALITDWEALGLSYRERRTKSIENPNGDYVNIFNKFDIAYFNDPSENGIVFQLA